MKKFRRQRSRLVTFSVLAQQPSMSATHTCFRSVLTQAFRPAHSRVAASFCVPEFLVPAVARFPRRPFSSSRRRRAEPHATAQAAVKGPQEASIQSKAPLQSSIPLPRRDARGDIQPWLDALDAFLPPRLRRSTPGAPDISPSVTLFDLASFLVASQDASQDILSHIGLVERRWETVVWIAKKLVPEGRQSIQLLSQLEPSVYAIWPEGEKQSLNGLTNSPQTIQRAPPIGKFRHSLDDLTSVQESFDGRQGTIKEALGHLWRSLGHMILVAAGGIHEEAQAIMPRVLEIIAYLHHVGLIPDSVYAHRPHQDAYALQQPPTLHLLSSKILTALSDATWRAHEASVKAATDRSNASYFLGHEIPGSRYKVHVTEVAPELWLELVLWSCLHGGWILDGSAILEQLLQLRGEQGWGLISWGELLQARHAEADGADGWKLFRRREEASAKAADRARTQRTISSEIVTAFVDGLVNTMRLGVGARGSTAETLLRKIKKLKHFLDVNSLSLGSATWDSVMLRLLESGGIVPEKRPELLLSVLDLASGFGTEVGTINALPKTTGTHSRPSYFFEPTTIPLSLLHRTTRSFVQNGDVAGAMTTLKRLQQYTDSNKQRSLQQFFEILKSTPLQQDEPFTSRIPPIDFPAFENQLPIQLLAKLLDLITDTRMFELGRSFLFSEDVDGPLIQPKMYGNWVMAAALIRFGTLAGENDLVLKIVKKTGMWSTNLPTQRLPHEFLTVLLCSQIQLHRWQSVSGMQDYVVQSSSYLPRPAILASFAAETLRFSPAKDTTQSFKHLEIRDAFRNFLYTWEDLVLAHTRNELFCVLGILSTVDEDLQQYCSQFLPLSATQSIKLSTEDFNQILAGLLDGYGSVKGRDIVTRWCHEAPRTFESYRAPGGLPTMSRFRASRTNEYESQPDNIEIMQSSGAKLVLQGRIHANRQTVWLILRKLKQEEAEQHSEGEETIRDKRAKMRETLQWAARLLYYMGLDYEDIMRDLGSLAELAQLQPPVAPRVVALDEGEIGL